MPDEIRALSRLAFDELGATTAGIAGVHRAIADRAFVAGAPGARQLHDAIAGVAYGAVRGGAALAGWGADSVLRRRPGGRQLSTTPRGAAALAALGGLIGDRLEREGSDLVEPMSVRSGVPSSYTVVFVHGLFETEHAWRFGGGESYGARLERDLGCAPVYVRYNTGRHVSENGLSLADLMARLADGAEIERIALVGHSMGGLVARSACHIAQSRGDRWVERVRHVITLGSPHRGAPLEEAVHMASAALAAVPETRAFARLLRRRSAGIRDMRRGSLVDADWRDRDPDALRAAACEEVPLLDGATHCFVAATVTRSGAHPVGRLVGDWLVLEPSASHRAQRVLHVGGAHHLALLNHPEVYERLREWLAPPRA
jgi:pimeloyl-ACP methyl ester carboxylesterase